MDAEVLRYINRLFAQHARKMRNMVARGVVKMVGDGTKMQTSQIALLDGELIDGAERPQQYGFSSHPQAGAECFVVFAGADRAHPLVLSVDDRRYRVQASAPGEVVIYTDEGDTITLKRNNTIEFSTKHLMIKAEEDVQIETKTFSLQASESADFKSANVAIQADSLSFANQSGGAVEAQFAGGINAQQDVKAGGVSLNGHTHSGITPGGGDTSKPNGG